MLSSIYVAMLIGHVSLNLLVESDLFTWEDLKEGCFERQSKSQRTADEFEEEYLR